MLKQSNLRTISKSSIFDKKYFLSLFLGLVTLLLLGFVLERILITNYLKQEADRMKSAEIKQIEDPAVVFEKKTKIYLKLIERVGPVQAQEELRHSDLPFTGTTHLLNHTVGKFLYEKYGPKAIIYCRDYFSSSCYHGIIINSLAEGKFDTVHVMMDACRKNGKGVLSQCIHGLGHGLLPYVGYKNLTAALSLCDKLGSGINSFSFYNCYNGVFMENIWGIHEGKPSPDRWTDVKDYHYPCNDSRIEFKYLRSCWYNQNSLLLTYYHGDISKVAKECNGLDDKSFKRECFEGLFNSIQGSSKGNVDKQFTLCKLMPAGWRGECLFGQIHAEIARGGLDSPFTICDRIAEPYKKRCYQIIQVAAEYYLNSSEKDNVCQNTPKKFKYITCKLTK